MPLISGFEVIGLVAATQAISSQAPPTLIGVINAFIVTGYFQLFHLALAGVTTDGGRTKELALAKIAGQIGGMCGASLGGFVSVGLGYGIPFFLSAVCYGVATLALAVICPRVKTAEPEAARVIGEVHAEPLIWTILQYPRQNIGVVLEVFSDFSAIFLLPVLFLRLGVNPAVIGLLHATRLTAALVLAPSAQRSVARGSAREFFGASLCGTGGWLLLLFAKPHVVVFLLAAILLGCKGFLFALGLESRWYARRSMSQILARELVLTAARLLAVPLLAWSAFNAPTLYLLIGLLSALLMYPYGWWLTKSQREGAV